MKYFSSSAWILFIALVGSSIASAQTEVTLIAPGSARAAIQQLVPGFESKTGYQVKVIFGSGAGTRQKVMQGEAIDVSVLQLPLEEVVKSGNVVAASQTTLATVSVGVVVKKGAPMPDISTPESVKKMMLGAKWIAYPDPASGGAVPGAVAEMFKRLGIAEQMLPKTKLTPNGGVAMELAAKGEVDFGLTFRSEMDGAGIDIVGAFPPEVCPPTPLIGFVSSHPKDPVAAKALLDYLSSPAVAAGYRAVNMNPGR